MDQHGGAAANLMHNPNLMHLQTQQQHHHLQQHSPHNPPPSQQQHSLELGGVSGSGSGAVLLSPAHLQQSPQSNRSSHSLQALSPPPPPQTVEEQHQQPHQQQQQQQEGATTDGGSTDPSTAHVINNITISPSSRHSFKMENM
ncbi:hypothetical protein M5D96_002780 [Drosophila gunungcola]|uniref:Uncharacterized protein n=1 Tax=Drosophila gunungcola TaxID=103775 RepID=A0A9P9Z0P2_9MUSC|nr:hypothetical protein M5D96_002780 [Drosophila gunungcola]